MAKKAAGMVVVQIISPPPSPLAFVSPPYIPNIAQLINSPFIKLK